MLLVSIICTTGPVFRIDFIPLDRHFLTQQCHVAARVKMASRYTFIRSSVYISPQIVNKRWKKKIPLWIICIAIWCYTAIHNYHLEKKILLFKFFYFRSLDLVLSNRGFIVKIKIIGIYKIPSKGHLLHLPFEIHSRIVLYLIFFQIHRISIKL